LSRAPLAGSNGSACKLNQPGDDPHTLECTNPGTTGIIGGINETANRVALKAAFNSIVAKTSDKNLHYVDGDSLYHHTKGGTARAWLDFEDPTVGGLHPSDLGHTRIAEFYQSFLPPLLEASDARAATATATERSAAALERQPAVAVTKTSQSVEGTAAISTSTAHALVEDTPMPGYAYTDLKELGVHGRAFNDTAEGQYYSRLPWAAKADVTAEVWGLSLMSTGLYTRFTTDAQTIHLPYVNTLPNKTGGPNLNVTACKALWHMPLSGACYLDLYAFDEAVQD
jgi:hypothetical protein